MATSKKQRAGILIIVVATVLGTLGSFAVMILSMQSNKQAQADYQKVLSEYKKEQTAYEQKKQAQADELSAKYYETFKQYSSQVVKFEIDSVKSLVTEDLTEGDGALIDDKTNFAAYYIGWDANGDIFDQSIDNNKLKTPLPVSGLSTAGIINGWKEGLKGMKIGGVRLLSIPADKAYGEAGSKDSSGKQIIAPNMPLKFVVMAIPAPETINQPDMTKLMNAYQQAQQAQ